MFEKTWSYRQSKELAGESELQCSDRKHAESPIAHAWDEGILRPKTQNEKTRRMRLIASQEKVHSPIGDDIINRPLSEKLYEVPIIVNRDEKYNRRILSAHIVECKSPKVRPSTHKISQNFQSSLDRDFLSLFQS